MKDITIRGRAIRSDENGLICLNDIWEAAGFKVNQKPSDWRVLPSSKNLQIALLDQIAGKSGIKGKIQVKTIIYSKVGKGGGTYAHPVLACAYAGHISPKLEIEVRETWLRYKAADATLADDILERAGPAANEWAGVRALTRTVRSKHVAVLADHGVGHPKEFAAITNETYIALFDGTAKRLKTERIEEMNPQGATRCQIAVRTSAKFIREAIEKDRASR